MRRVTFEEKKIRITNALDMTLGKVMALCAGAFAVHPNFPDTEDRGLYTITHLPTGYAVTKRAPNVDKAKQAVKILLAAPIDWQKLTDNRRTKVYRQAKQVYLEIKEKGLIEANL